MFVGVLSFMILMYSEQTHLIVQVLTTGKALVLACSVFSVLVLSNKTNIVKDPVTNWSAAGSGFLMGTVALGEAAQVQKKRV